MSDEVGLTIVGIVLTLCAFVLIFSIAFELLSWRRFR